MSHTHALVVVHAPNHNRVKIPLAKDVNHLSLAPFVSYYQHALLRLGEQHFIGRHFLLALWYQRQIQLNAGAGSRGHLARG